MDKEKIIISYFKLNEKERQEGYLATNGLAFLKKGLIAVGKAHFAVLEDNGRVIAYGDNNCGQCDTQGWENVSKVVAGDYHTAALLNDGTVVATGDNTHGQCNVGEWRNISDIYAVNHLTVGVKADGNVTVASPTQQNVNKGQSQPINYASSVPNPNQTELSDYSDYEWEEEKDGVKITKYKGNDNKVVIPETILGKPVRVIGFSAFWRNSFVKYLVLPQNLRVVGVGAFSCCENLEFVEIPYGTEIVESSSFGDCYKLETLTIPSSVKEIGQHAFVRCTNLMEIVIPDSVQTIGKYAFAGCKKINKVTISPQTRKRIDPWGDKIPK